MKTLILWVMLIACMIVYGQSPSNNNRSDGSIFTSIPSSLSGERFRFAPGIITQLDQGTFGFGANDRWWSQGRLNTGSQQVYGLRFQNGGKSLIMGYNNLNNINPRIQWIGEEDNNTLGNLEFRVANDFFSTNSQLVATMRKDGSTLFGSGSGLEDSKVGINNRLFLTPIIGLPSLPVKLNGLKIITSTSFLRPPRRFNGINISTSGAEFNYGAFSSLGDNLTNYAIYGRSTGTASGNDYAAFFEGDVEITGSLFQASDKKLKKDIEAEENMLEKINQLNPVHYMFKENKHLTLPKTLQHGVIAQELEDVFPELVQDILKPITNDKGEVTGEYTFKSVNYQGLITVMAQSIKELNAKVEQLEGQLNQVKQTMVVTTNSLSSEQKASIEKDAYSLEQNYPNPFDGVSVIEYGLPEGEGSASIMIFDMTGNFLKEYKLKERRGKVQISAEEYGAGVYLYSLVSGNREIISKRMIVK